MNDCVNVRYVVVLIFYIIEIITAHVITLKKVCLHSLKNFLQILQLDTRVQNASKFHIIDC
jgi:hypothetical protein